MSNLIVFLEKIRKKIPRKSPDLSHWLAYYQSLSPKKQFFVVAFGLMCGWFMGILPAPLFHRPMSTVIEAERGELLGARIADDGQWRFPLPDSVPSKFARALVQFEDRRFRYHPGIDPVALVRAFYLNIKHLRVVSGGSTLTMQVARLSRENPPRHISEKLYETLLALRIELAFSKDEILRMYAAHAPFGGNVVGIEAAAWRYFGLRPHQLSWAESAMLAVLPNSPALVHPGRNRQLLKAKRDKLLASLYDDGYMDEETYRLSEDEPLPDAPRPFPMLVPHLLEQQAKSGLRIRSSINYELQNSINGVVARQHAQLAQHNVYNAAALVLDTRTGDVKAYVGNFFDPDDESNGYHVDIIRAPRSTGSILKPFLYAAMLTEGQLLPQAIVPDVPLYIGNFAPKNFSLSYDGAVPADKALARSLNVPAVFMLRDYSVAKFHAWLTRSGITTLSKPPKYYGLSLVLGGAEGTLWDITGAYASMARHLMAYNSHYGQYWKGAIHPPVLQHATNEEDTVLEDDSYLSASAVWYTLRALLEVERPGEDNQWRNFSSSKRIAWKTGTSFGFRDAWAVGVTPDYTVGVWVGNADGEGRPGIIGARTAAPVLFEIFDQLDCPSPWFSMPKSDMTTVNVCDQSGFLAGPNCEKTHSQWLPRTAERSDPCPYHQIVHTDLEGRYRVTRDCQAAAQIRSQTWFVLPPAMETYFRKKNSTYRPLPPWKPGCGQDAAQAIQIIYPQGFTQMYIPRGLDGKRTKLIFEIAHRNPETTVYWYIDDQYLGTTQHFHQMAVQPPVGRHTLLVTDEAGNSAECPFEILSAPQE